MAELERGTLVYFTPYWMTLSSKFLIDPQHSTAKRQQRTQAFTSQLAHASLERQLASLTTTKNELEKKLREKDSMIDRLEKDRRWLSERETEEREEKERERLEWDEAKVCILVFQSIFVPSQKDPTYTKSTYSGNQNTIYDP